MSLKASIFLVISTTLFLFGSISCIDFVYNTNFTSTNLLLVGTATVGSPPSILTLTNDTTFSIGRGLYPSRIAAAARTTGSAAAEPLPFATSFVFSMARYRNSLPGHGFAFVFVPSAGIENADPVQHLGMFNFTNNGNSSNRIFGVEFDVFANQEFNDINDNHVGVDVNSLTSVSAATAGFWRGKKDEKFTELKLNSGVNYQVWIEFNGSAINVTMARAGAKKPRRPLISTLLNLTGVLLDEMFVGFTGATGQLVQSHRILSWSFSNSNFSIGDVLVTSNLPSFVSPKKSAFQTAGFIVGVCVGIVFVLVTGLVLCVVFVRRRRRKRNEDIEDWETEYWPHRIPYQEILAATNEFSEENVIGFGGNTKVYKGVLAGTDVAVKRFNSHESVSKPREFVAEVSSLGRLKHRNLVGLRGWCSNEKGGMILVYDYMENGSVDMRIFDCDENLMLSWDERMKVVRDVASGILYLHEEWEAKVLHRDIKSSNVLLDKDMNARLGDFGLAKMHHHQGELASTTRVVGTVGYIAPEMVKTGRATTQTDVYGFGALVLEVVCGRRPVEEGKPNLIESLWRLLMERDEVVDALDERLKSKGGYKKEDVERVLQMGMLCVHPDARVRPTMRQVVKILKEGRFTDERDEGFDGEGMEVSLLERVTSSGLLRSCSHTHPTFEEIRNSLSYSISFTSSDSIREGR